MLKWFISTKSASDSLNECFNFQLESVSKFSNTEGIGLYLFEMIGSFFGTGIAFSLGMTPCPS